MANAIFAVVYTSDKGKRYKVGMNSEVFSQLASGGAPKVGGTLWDGSELLDGMPANMRPRQARVHSAAAGKTRYVTILDSTATLNNPSAILADRQITLEDSDGVSSTFTFDGPLAEKMRTRKRRS